jgi:hypothetical protein
MTRYAFILLAALGTFAAAAAFQDAPAAETRAPANQTVVEKNSAFPVIGPVVFTECRTTDCSELPDQ